MPETFKKLRIFAASPSDVASERAKLETVVDSLKPMADYLGLTLEVVDWRAVVPDAGRPQQIIFDQLKPTSWDIFIGVLWHRFGTPPGGKDKDGKDYLSGTEEEFKTAYELWKQHGKPRMVLYRCTRALPFDVDPDQLKNVRVFFKLIEDVKGDYPTLYQAFDTTESFEKLVLNNLQKLLIEYGDELKRPITAEVVQVFPLKIPNNLPRKQAFFGRIKEMDMVMRAISPDDRTWGVLVDGIGGIGKSAIAVKAAYHAQELGLFDAYVFITAKQNILDPGGIKELNPPARTLDEFLNETARVLGQSGIAKLPGDEKRRGLIDILRSMRTLLIFDNLETLSKEEQEGIADFLRELPQGCKAIITSRRRGGEGGVWLHVEKLDWEAARGIIKNQMSLDTGLANKLNRVGEARWQELFDEINGSPLALVHVLGLMRVRAVLSFDKALEMLRGNHDEDLQKFIFQEARKELTENDKIALGALSFFEPSTTFEAWMKVADLSRNVLETTIDRLCALSLIDLPVGEERYILHPLTRAFVRSELLSDSKPARKLGLRFAQYWGGYISQYGGSRENYEEFSRLEDEWDVIAYAVRWVWENAGIEDEKVADIEIARKLVPIVRNLWQFIWSSGRLDYGKEFSEWAYHAAIALKDWSNAGWRAYDIANIENLQNQPRNAMKWVELCSKAWNQKGGKRELATAKRLRGLILEQLGDYEYSVKLIREALTTFHSEKMDRDEVSTLNYLGALARKHGNYSEAEQYHNEALVLAKSTENKGEIARSLNNLGELALANRKLSQAQEWFAQALIHAREIGRINTITQANYGLARVYEAEGNIDLALSLAQEVLKVYERLRHRDFVETRELVERLKKIK